MKLQDLLKSAVAKVRGTNMVSPVSANYTGGGFGGQQSTYPEYMDALKSSGRPAVIHTDNPQEFSVAKQQLQARSMGVDPSSLPMTPAPSPVMPSPTPQPRGQVLGTTTGDMNFQNLVNVAREKAQAKGFHPAPIVSQMASESMRGKSRFAKERNNLFGIGAFDNDLDNTHRYESPEASIDAYIDLISNDPRYAKAYEQRQDPVAYINAINAAGYATDPNYVQTTMNTPEWRAMMQ